MNTVTRQLRSGFMGIEILVVLIIIVLLFSALASLFNPSAPAGKQAGVSAQGSGSAQTVNDAVRTGTAVIRMTGAAGSDQPPAAAPTPDPAADPAPTDPAPADPTSGDGLDGIIQDILDGL
jgi:type II secretory pathway pseudopilin PulG